MGFRFRKTIKLFPGVKINLSKSGISTTIGVRGASVNIGKDGTRGTVGLPGTGISYSQKLSGTSTIDDHPSPRIVQQIDPPKSGSGLIWFIVIVAIGVMGFQLFGR